MATSTFNIAIVLSAIDRMSGVINSGVNQSIASLDKMKKAGQENMMKGAGMFGSGLAVAAAMKPALDAYEELEAAQAKMASRVMRAGGGIDKTLLGALNAESERLGNKLPGTTAELTDMFTVMLEGGVDAKRIVEGLGAATSEFAVVAGMAYPEAAKFVSRMSLKVGIAGEDAEGFLDIMNKIKQSGPNVDEIGYAYSGVGPLMKTLGESGLESFRKFAPVMSQLIQTVGGEKAGTSTRTLFRGIFDTKKLGEANAMMKSFGGSTLSFLDKTGKYKGNDNLFTQFEKISKLNQGQRRAISDALAGSGEDAATFAVLTDLMANGMAKYNNELAKIDDRGTLQEQLKVQLETFKALKEAAGGTWTNALAAMAESLKPEIIAITKALGEMAKWIQVTVKANPEIFKFVGVFMALTSTALMLGGAFLTIKGAWLLFSALSLASPIGWVLGLAAAIALVVANWDKLDKELSGGNMFGQNDFLAVWAGRIEALKNIFAPVISMIELMLNPDAQHLAKLTNSWNNVDPSAAYKWGYDNQKKEELNEFNSKQKFGKAGNYVMNYSPTITIQGNADKAVLMQALKGHSESLHEQDRISFGPSMWDALKTR